MKQFNKVEKDQFQSGVELYLEKNMIFEFFNALLKEVCVKQPEKPIDWLISRLKMKSPYRIIILGSPGGLKKEICKHISDSYELKHINSASLLIKEIEDENSSVGKQLKPYYNELDYVDDNIVTNLVIKILNNHDK